MLNCSGIIGLCSSKDQEDLLEPLKLVQGNHLGNEDFRLPLNINFAPHCTRKMLDWNYYSSVMYLHIIYIILSELLALL